MAKKEQADRKDPASGAAAAGAGKDARAEDGPAPGDPDEGGTPGAVKGPGEDPGSLPEEWAQWRDKALRARADYANLERRVREESALERERAKARVLEAFLQVYEYGQMAAFEAERNPGPLADGVKMLVREFDRALAREGVTPVGEVGEPFDASRHEAVGAEQAPDVPPGHVSRVVAPGYRLGDRVLRYAKVAVMPHSGGEAGSATAAAQAAAPAPGDPAPDPPRGE